MIAAGLPGRRTAAAAPADLMPAAAAPLRGSLMLLAFLMPLEWPNRFTYELTTMAGAVVLVCASLRPGTSFGRIPWPLGWFALYVYVLLVALMTQGVTYPGGLYSEEVTKLVLLLLLWIGVFWACANLLQDERLSRAVLLSLILGCMLRAAMPLLGLARSALVQGIGGERVTVLGQNPNQSAQVLAIGLLALIGLAYIHAPQGRRLRLAVWGGVVLLAVGLVETASRGGLITLTTGLLAVLAAGRSWRVRLRNACVALVALTILGFAFSRSELARRRVDAAVHEGELAGREEIFPLLVDMAVEKPLLGWGPIANKYELAARLRSPTHARRDTHNILLEVLTAGGLLGTIPFLLGTWLCVRAAWKARVGPRGTLPLAMLLAVLAGNMGGNRLTGPLLWLVLAYAWASGNSAAAGRGADGSGSAPE